MSEKCLQYLKKVLWIFCCEQACQKVILLIFKYCIKQAWIKCYIFIVFVKLYWNCTELIPAKQSVLYKGYLQILFVPGVVADV